MRQHIALIPNEVTVEQRPDGGMVIIRLHDIDDNKHVSVMLFPRQVQPLIEALKETKI